MSTANILTNFFTEAAATAANNLVYLSNNNNNNNSNLTADSTTNEKLIITIVGSIGAFFNSLNILLFLFRCNKNESTKASELIAYMNISSLINTISYMLYFNKEGSSNVPKSPLCDAQGCLMVFSELSQFSTASLISIYISNNIFNFESNEFTNKKRIPEIFFGFIFPFLLVLIGYFFNVFGLNGRWCWIKSDFGNSLGFAFYLIIWLTMILNICLIAYSYCKIKNTNVDYLNLDDVYQVRNEMSHLKMMAIFPLLLIICWFFPTVNRVIILYGYDKDQTIEILHVTMILLLGVFISVTSFLFVDFRRFCKSIKGCFCDLFSKCGKENRSNMRLSADNLSLSAENFRLSEGEIQRNTPNDSTSKS